MSGQKEKHLRMVKGTSIASRRDRQQFARAIEAAILERDNQRARTRTIARKFYAFIGLGFVALIIARLVFG